MANLRARQGKRRAHGRHQAMPTTNTVRISALVYDQRDEYVQITSDGPATQEMTSWTWTLQSVTGDQWYLFLYGYMLPVGASLRVHCGPEASALPPWDLFWHRSYVWNDRGDEAWLYDASGGLVAAWGY